jgi:hypothetical protein
VISVSGFLENFIFCIDETQLFRYVSPVPLRGMSSDSHDQSIPGRDPSNCQSFAAKGGHQGMP